MSKLFLIILLVIPLFFFSQSKKADSLNILIKKCSSDTELINLNLHLITEIESSDPERALIIANSNSILSNKISFKNAYCSYVYSYLLANTSNFKESLINYRIAELLTEKTLKDKEQKALLGKIYSGMASVYSLLQNNKAAILSAKKCIEISKLLNDKKSLTIDNFNLGNYYIHDKNIDEAIIQFKIAEQGFKELNDSVNLNYVYNSFGNCYFEKKEYEKALYYFQKSHDITSKVSPNDLSSIAVSLANIGEVYAILNQYDKALINCIEASKIFEQLNDKTSSYITYENIAKIYSMLKNYEKSNEYYKKYVSLKDSVFDEDTKNTIHEMSVKYESEKKEQENQLLTLENKNKSQVIYFALGGCALLFGLVFFIFRGYRNKQKANILLEEKNNIIQHQKEVVEEQHQDITDSIKYAKRIQGAILPPRNLWTKILPESFVLYMPKDVLSGDFYWIEETKDYIYVAAADCTGHGVPGALISIVNYNLLNKAILEKGLVTPSEILDSVNLWLTESLHQTYRESAVRDGMDVTLIAIHKHSNEVLFAGANNPIYLVSNGELKQIKGDKFPVGAFIEDQIQHFTTKSFKTQPGDCIYMFSDGFADQFGGDNGKKYKYAPFQRKLIDIYSLPLSEQRNIMRDEFLKWKGSHEQVDDVLLVGIKIA